MSTAVNKYRIWCNTEDDYFYVWAEAEPTVCPNNSGHSVDSSKTTVDQAVEENTVEIKEENTPTGGHYKAYGVCFSANASGETIHDFSLPYDISLLSATVPTADLNSGDIAEFYIAPDAVIGAIVSNVTLSDSDISVQQTVIDNLKIGRSLKLDDGTNSESHIVTAINTASNVVSFEVGTTHGYLAATPTYCKMTIIMGENIEVSSGTRIVLGESKIGGSHIPANTTIRVKYNNTGGSPVKVRIYLEYLY